MLVSLEQFWHQKSAPFLLQLDPSLADISNNKNKKSKLEDLTEIIFVKKIEI